jgi:hypothetical protein
MSDNHLTPINEIWKAIPGFPAYDVSNRGRVRSYWRFVKIGYNLGSRSVIDQSPQKILKHGFDKDGYPKVTLREDRKPHSHRVHQLVLRAFVGPCPEGLVSMHLDGTRDNNFLSNLCYGTQSENHKDKFKHGYNLYGMNGPSRKLTDSQVRAIRDLYAHGSYSHSQLGKIFNVSSSNIGCIVNHQTWFA